MRHIRILSLALVLLIAPLSLEAQIERWTVDLRDELSISDVAVMDDGTVIVALATNEWREHAASTLVRFRPGEAAATELGTFEGLGINGIEVLEGDGVSLLVRGAVGEQLAYRLYNLKDGRLVPVWDMAGVELPADPELPILVVSQDAKSWATCWIGDDLETLHVAVGSVPNGTPILTADLKYTIDPPTEPLGEGPDPFMEWPDELYGVELLTLDGGDLAVAALWRGSTQLIRSSDRAASSLLRPSLHGGARPYWSPIARRLWIRGFHAWSAFQVDDPALFAGEAVVGPDAELANDDLDIGDPITLRDRADGTILVVDFQGHCLVLRLEPSGEPKVVAEHDLGPDIFPATASRSGELVVGIVDSSEDGELPDTVVMRPVPLVAD